MDIFTDEELKAADATEVDAASGVPDAGVGQDDQPRDDQGRFATQPDAQQPDAQQPDPAATDQDDKQRTVPQGALHAERERRKAAETKASAAEAEAARFREQFAGLQALRDQIAARKPEPLPEADDPAALNHLRNRMSEIDQRTTQTQNRLDMEQVNRTEMQQLGSVMQTSEAAFRQEKPDYDQAIEHVVTARARELALYGMQPAQINLTIAEEAADIVRSAVAQGRNPAELGYEIALARGYRVPTPAGGGASATLDAIARGQAVGKSVGQGAGVATKELNAQSIAAMTQDEFDALYTTPEGRRMIDNL